MDKNPQKRTKYDFSLTQQLLPHIDNVEVVVIAFFQSLLLRRSSQVFATLLRRSCRLWYFFYNEGVQHLLEDRVGPASLYGRDGNANILGHSFGVLLERSLLVCVQQVG
jgi:hypothetical protein